MLKFTTGHDRQIAQELRERLEQLAESQGPFRFMHVCGTHTWNYLRYGLPSLVPPQIELLAGPGCPVCVTTQDDVDWLVSLAEEESTILATFGDMMRVPGSSGFSLLDAKSRGADVRVILSPLNALAMARAEPQRWVILAAVGFETTAPTVAATLESAQGEGITNLGVALLLKRLVPALYSLLQGVAVDGLLCPGHVAAVTGWQPFARLADAIRLPCAVAGFGPVEILSGLAALTTQRRYPLPRLANAYPQAVTQFGNQAAQSLVEHVFSPGPATWRGLGSVPQTGYRLRAGFARYDVARPPGQPVKRTGCLCDQVLLGRKRPADCRLYARRCTPDTPVGPCMVSREGTCAAYYYHAAV